ncbi:adenosylcobinamide-GDP ribazoletransferase [Blastococcus sp. TML/M2B]|uniref:adenosylcobinamide-GDP ribazoletransferase n=1 Tax=unclassified Blastococcus TaxID=2619396 RepID=UPI0019096259|nr:MULTISPECIES: adenosylcobinamide-GDP ribazoletransferase [unclassified Blastococcus]MBN1091393.1 adenosylcobinamide-GDP ribazoletransferase [Blastococcus sp. TML/M2B]MBN1095050.1 adenosylcobinamide-GDP ribazoletransferase [Blastococcus sp. TML/C7B]
MRTTGPWESVALLTALPVPASGARSTRGVLPWAPLVGLLLGGVAAAAGDGGARVVSPLTGAVLAVAALALLTRGLHLDGLADTADGLGPLRGRERALQVMHQSDVGPFGVVTLVLTLLLQIACLAALLPRDGGWLVLWAAVVGARLVMARSGLPGIPVAEGSSLGRTVAGTVSRAWFAGAAAATVLLAAGVAAALFGPGQAAVLLGSLVAGAAAAEVLHRRAVRRLGGTTGDVMGATAEVATAATLLVAAALW